MREEKILAIARDVLQKEKEGIQAIIDGLGEDFIRAVRLILSKKGRVIVTGLGKSGIVAKKIAATLTSTGTPAIYLHPTESLHGDLGIVSRDDVVLAISKSGESDEFHLLIPLLKRWNLPIIAITANKDSELAHNSDVVLEVKVDKEACPYDLAPTVSTTATMALGDALSVVLLFEKNFRLEDFAALHPGGFIGKRFWLKVEDMMLTGEKYVPVVGTDADMKQVILEMTAKRGITSVVNEEKKVVGVITDGDLRRLLERESDIFRFKASDVMNRNP
ncbi:MAG: D-arabinose 5-phosphate isomerase, partial [Candidatus Hydrothermota bacterium]